MRRLLSILMCLWVAAGIAAAQVGPAVSTERAETRLVASTMSAAPGTVVTLGLVQKLADGWHVYWQNPGDSGLPLTLEWDVPAGYAAGEVAYPLPHRLPLGPLMNFGHEGEPTFLVPLTVPQDARVGQSVVIKVRADWLICKDICVPEGADLQLLLPITETAGGPTIGYADRIAAAAAEQPTPVPFALAYHDSDAGPVLRLAGAPRGEIEIYPYAPSLIEPSAEVSDRVVGDERWLGMAKGFAYEAAQPEAIAGVLTLQARGERVGYTFRAPRTDAPAINDARAAAASGPGLMPILLAAVLGGVLLNVMPCVFPIVFLKAAGFAAIPREERGAIRRHGLLYTAGVLIAFAALGLLLAGLRAGGEEIGWGFHLQSPVAVGVFAGVLFAVGLNLAGLFEFGTSAQGVGTHLASRSGDAGAFFTGLLAVAVAAPCIGPFLGAAVGLAVAQPATVGVLIFVLIGVGLALPYLLISLFPILSTVLPRPGPWMVTLRQLFSFAMFATVVWLVWVLAQQAGPAGILRLGIALVVIAFAAWLFGRSQRGGGLAQRLAALGAVIAAVFLILGVRPQAATAGMVTANELTAVPYSTASLAELRAAGTPVFVDFTAAWCVSCQFNKRTVLDTPAVAAAFDAAGVTYMVADWTLRDPEITKALEAYGRAGVPLYLYFGPGEAEATILPAMLSKRIVLSLVTE